MIGQAVGIEGYIATYRLRPVTNEPGKTFLEWPRELAVAPGQNPDEVVPFITSLASKEVAEVKRHFASRASK